MNAFAHPSSRGLVSRRRNPVNRRFYQVTLTDQGRSVTSRLVASMHPTMPGCLTP
jgi:DNA-binding MarR family transcriptional regulator